jgi:hypothetical protein
MIKYILSSTHSRSLRISNNREYQKEHLNDPNCPGPFCGGREGFNMFKKLLIEGSIIEGNIIENPFEWYNQIDDDHIDDDIQKSIIIGNYRCPVIKPILFINIDKILNFRWYIHMQQINPYQNENSLFCVTKTFTKRKDGIIDINLASSTINLNKHNLYNPNICIKNKRGGEFNIQPCFFFDYGLEDLSPYWIIEIDKNYQWMIIIGGQPKVNVFNNFCRTSLENKYETGLWLLTRSSRPRPQEIKLMLNILKAKRIGIDFLRPVKHINCNYL